ncbi:MAG: alpha/beta hydrolase [Prevotella sp.]|nr:alpha/beta hydrolase [Prevotella sp.]
MKRIMISLLVVLVAMTGRAQTESATDLLGSWTGKLNVGAMSLTLVLHLEQQDDGNVKVTMDSPDQGAKGIAATKEYLSGDSMAIKVAMIGMTYRAKLKDGKLDGTFSQNGMSLPLVMTRGGVAEVKRPQTPQTPYPYETEEVTFTNEKDGATLAGTLTYPVGYDKESGKPVGGNMKSLTVVLFVSGSGQQNRDEELFNHKPFLVIADYLARHGIASLRYDDRATGASKGGEVKNATSEDFMRDAEAGLNYLRNQKKFKKIGVLGHSEGGLIAFMLGARKKTDFIVSLAGPGVKGDTLLAAQTNRLMELSGMSATMTAEQYRQLKEVRETPWLQWFINYDPSDNILNSRCPVFALNGDRDCQVLSSQNLPPIQRLLPKSKKNLIKEYPGLNHLFQHCTTGLPTEYGQIEETISQEVLQDIVQWIQGL